MISPPVFFPHTVVEASQTLSDYDGTAKVVAGSTALTLMINQNLVAPEALVSLRRIPGLREIFRDGDVIRAGALVTHAEAARHPVLRDAAPVVAEAFAVVGNAQVRAAATVGGVMAEADYASDPPAAMALLDATVVTEALEGSRTIPASEFLLGFYETALNEAEVVTEVRIPKVAPDAGTAYLKYSARSAEDRPCVGVAALVRLDDDGTCADLRVSVGAAAEVPLRLREVEARALGHRFDAGLVCATAEAYADSLDPVADVRGSAWYRTEMTRVWVDRALHAAAQKARQRRTA